MEFEKLNKAALPKIAFGTWAWGSGMNGGGMVFGGTVDAAEIKKTFDAAQKAGFTVWDTASVYGLGSSESLLAECAGQSPDIIYSTKFTPIILRPKSAMEKALDNSLERLGQPCIDIYWIHMAENVKKWTKEIIPLVKKNKVKYVGLSNHSLAQLKTAQQILNDAGIPLSAVQNHYSLLYRASETTGILEWTRENDIPFFAYMVLEQGMLTGRYTAESPFPRFSSRGMRYPKSMLKKVKPLQEKIKAIAEAHQVEQSAVVMAWALSKDTIPLVGVTKERHLQAPVQAVGLTLLAEEIMTLEAVAGSAGVSTKGFWEQTLK